MEKITNYLELIQQIQDITPEKEAFCTTGRSLTYSQLYALAKETPKSSFGTSRQPVF